jgi:hypothetical protein
MLETHAHQASGLLELNARRGPRMLTVVSHGDEQSELPLLWHLCLALVNFGYSVTVLDATSSETPGNPGLAELLDSVHWRDDAIHGGPAWTVLPAAKGVARLSNSQFPPLQALQQLGNLFSEDGVVVLYSNVEWMIPLVGSCQTQPLLAVSEVRDSLLTSYLALKRLLILGKLRPTIVNMMKDKGPVSNNVSLPTPSSLSICAKRFLGYDVSPLNISEQQEDAIDGSDIQRLALKLLEGAILLGPDQSPIDMQIHYSQSHLENLGRVDHFAGSH